jgi:surface antigen
MGLTMTPVPAVIAETIIAPTPAYAGTEFSNDYPDMDAKDCSRVWGSYSWCKGDPSKPGSSRGYDFRNCPDGAAYWVGKYTGVNVAGWGHAKSWNVNAASKDYTVYPGNTNSIEPGDIAQDDTGDFGHVGFVTNVTKDNNGNVTTIKVAELNKDGAGNYSHDTYSTKDAAGHFKRNRVKTWKNFIDVNGIGKGLNNEQWPDTITQDEQEPPTHPLPPQIPFGNWNYIPLTGDWNNNRVTDIGAWYNGHFYLYNYPDGTTTTISFGNWNDTPLSGNWDGPGATQVGVWRQGTFYLRHSNGNVSAIHFGNNTDIPLTGDWDANGVTDVGVWRQGVFYLQNTNGTVTTIPYGNHTDKPITGKWNGPGSTQVGVWRNGTFYKRNSNNTTTATQFGNHDQTPITGDWNGDGTTSVGVVGGGVFWVR